MKLISFISLWSLLYISCISTSKKIVEPESATTFNSTVYVKYAVLNLFFEEPEETIVYGPGELFMNNAESYFRWNYFCSDSFSIPENSGYIALPKDAVDGTGNIIHMNFQSNNLMQRENFGEYFFTEEAIPKMNWVISNKKKEIEGMNSILATTNFRGRNYSAWFTPEIPIHKGPWKFHGLPGLILEVSDSDGKFSYTAIEIKYPYHGKSPNFSKDNGKKLSWEEFAIVEKIVRKELERETKANNTDRSGDFQVTVYDQVRQEIFTPTSEDY